MESIGACDAADIPTIFEIVNDAARAYKGVIPDDAWHEPYMPLAELEAEIAKGVHFHGYEIDGRLAGVMGIQHVKDVALIRHAYTRTALRGRGVGRSLLQHVCLLTERPMLVGTWRAADWAIRFYEKNGFTLVYDEGEKDRLLREYWTISRKQAATSVVLADDRARHLILAAG